ncbi:MAG: hypothetical protein CFE26_16270 [Verrucomicrobiales bacterium VVV1]|nr:MAG: hypothetical protein CFE26_16270 [Verrucomicrobiales bacterium VVV1]
MRELLFIDPHFVSRSPALKSILREFPESFDDFDRVEVWAVECDFDHPKIHFDPIWCPFKSWYLVSLWYWVAVHLRYFWRFFVMRHPRHELVQATNYYCYWADLIYFHFSFLAYARVIRQHSGVFRLSLSMWIVFVTHYIQEWILFKLATPRWWWVVSRRLKEESACEAGPGLRFAVLPNAYDGERFSMAARDRHRDEMRKQLGFSSEEVVFIFVSLGGLERKGFNLAAQAVGLLSAGGRPVRLLFVGGPTEEPMDLKPFLSSYGISDSSFIRQIGRVKDIERYMAAADGLLFPSFCEAFALVEIESAALGLRLYLTPHYGSEMILRPPMNGRYVPWDAEGIAKILAEDIDSGAMMHSSGEMGEALDRQGFLAAIRKGYQEILNEKARESFLEKQ